MKARNLITTTLSIAVVSIATVVFTTASANEVQYDPGAKVFLHLDPNELIILPAED